MGRADEIAEVRTICESILRRRGAELFDLELHREGPGRVLQVTVDGASGDISVEEIAAIAEEISRALDLADPIAGRYTLEVSSPGIERPLRRPADYRRFAGREVSIRCVEMIEGRRSFQGKIRSAGEDSFVLDLGSELAEIPYVSVGRARLAVNWEEELRR